MVDGKALRFCRPGHPKIFGYLISFIEEADGKEGNRRYLRVYFEIYEI